MLDDILIKNGLNDKESKIYLAVLRGGEMTIAAAASRARLERTTVYSLVPEMVQKRLLFTSKRRGIQYVSALAPRLLIEHFKESARAAEHILPALLDLASASPVQPRLRLFEGMSGLKDILRDVSFSRDPVTGFTDYEQMPKELFQFIRKEVVPRRRKLGTFIRLIVPRNATNMRMQKEDNEHYGEHRLMDFPSAQNPMELLLYGASTVAFLSFTQREMFGVTIDSPAIHRTLKNIFEAMWRGLEKK